MGFIRDSEEKEYGIRWSEFDRNDRLVVKERIFKTEKARDKAIEKLEQKPNFNAFEAWLN